MANGSTSQTRNRRSKYQTTITFSPVGDIGKQ